MVNSDPGSSEFDFKLSQTIIGILFNMCLQVLARSHVHTLEY